MVWPYGKPEVDPQFGDPSGYGHAVIAAATRIGFTFYGWAPDLKGPKYRVDYAILVSPQNDSFMIVGVGTIFGIPLQGIWIHTPAIDERSYYSANHQNCIEIDISRKWKSQLVPGADFTQLWQKHREWLAGQRVIARGLQKGREFESFYQVRLEHFRLMASRGYISFTDSTETYWRYTFHGAVKLAVIGYGVGMLRALTFGRLPRAA